MDGSRARSDGFRSLAVDLGLVFAAKAAVGLYVLHAGFSHISDDDFARVVIAQQFAHRPTLDPSGTSWLPFPFWIAGGAMLVLGRSLDAARTVAFVLGVASVAVPYLAMRAVGCKRGTSLVAVGAAMALPWSAWVGVATVPEAFTACLVSGGAIAVTAPRARIVAAVALLASALARYEAWPACATFALTCALSARRESRGRASTAAATAIALAGPCLWMLWNARAHGSALHFVTRVAAYRQAIGAAAIPLSEKLAAFPAALANASPSIVGLALLGLLAIPSDAALRKRWLSPLGSAVAILAFLVYGDVRDGAPTHHPERAVLPILWILAPFAADALRTLAGRVAWGRPQREMVVFGVAAAGALAWAVALPRRLRDAPGLSASESRAAQTLRGRELARTSDPHERWVVTPCGYEHFALVAAESEPERFTLLPPTHEAVTPACPRLESSP